jgi:long-chain acyl-CoA synthetase
MSHVDAIAAMLVHKYGVKKGDRVAIAMRNYPEWVMSFAAILSIGAISVSFNAWWTEDENDFALEDCGAKVLLCDEERAERSAGSLKRLGIHGVVCRSSKPLPAGFDRWEDSIMLGEAMPAVDIAPDDDATILYTSGTTGRPKGAVSTHRSIRPSWPSPAEQQLPMFAIRKTPKTPTMLRAWFPHSFWSCPFFMSLDASRS